MKTWLIAMILTLGNAAMSAERPMTIEWTDGPKLPMGLGGHVAAVIDDEIVVAGGTNWHDEKKFWHDEIWALDEKAGEWRERGKLPIGLALPAATQKDGALLLLGGWTANGPTARTFRYKAGEAKGPFNDLPAPRALAGGAGISWAAYVIGGLSDPVDFKTARKSVLRLDFADEKFQWREVAPLPAAVALTTTVTLGDKVYLFGGMGPSGNATADSADAFRYDPPNDQWTKISPLPGPRRGAAGVAIDDRRILIVGGCRGEKDGPVMLDEVLAYDIRDDRYATCTPLSLAALCEQAVLKNGRIYVIGGEDKPRHRTDRVIIGTIMKSKG